MKTTIKAEKIMEVLKESIDKYRVVDIYYKNNDRQLVSELFTPYLIMKDQEDGFEVLGKNLIKDKRCYFTIKNISSVEMTNTIFKVEKKVKYRCMGREFIKAIKEVDINLDDPDDEYFRQPCLYCDSEDICTHVLYDYNFFDDRYKVGRINEVLDLKKIIEDVFLYFHKNKLTIESQKKELNDKLFDLWEDSEFSEKWGISVDDNLYMSLIDFIINEDIQYSVDVMTFNYATGGGVGMDDSMQVCYARDPDQIIKLIREHIKEYLAPFYKIMEQ